MKNSTLGARSSIVISWQLTDCNLGTLCDKKVSKVVSRMAELGQKPARPTKYQQQGPVEFLAVQGGCEGNVFLRISG